MGVFARAADLLERQAVHPFTLLGYEPTCLPRSRARDQGIPDEQLPAPCGLCPQERFHAARELDVFYGGAAGGGKTKALLMAGLEACHQYPGLRVGAFRRTYDELEESLLKELQTVAYAEALGATWNGTARELRFPNRSIIRFRYAENIVDASRRQGGEYQLLLIDERTLMPPDAVGALEERVRSGRKDLPVLGIRSASNPGGPGHAVVKARYIEATSNGAHTYVDGHGRSVRFIPAKVADNPHLNADYTRTLQAIADPARRAAMLDGSWDSFAGQMFEEWRREDGQRAGHVVPRFEISPEWRRYAGMDYGWTAPTIWLWAAHDQDARLWVYRELEMRKTPELEQARRVLECEQGETILRRNADPSTGNQTGAALPVSSQYALNGVPLQMANNDRVSGWTRVHTYLADGPACAHHRALGYTLCPMLHVLDGTAPYLQRTLPSLPRSARNPEDVDTTADDHAADALRYLLMGIGLVMTVPATLPQSDDSHELSPDRLFAYSNQPGRGLSLGF